jgi:hypothetical protein
MPKSEDGVVAVDVFSVDIIYWLEIGNRAPHEMGS